MDPPQAADLLAVARTLATDAAAAEVVAAWSDHGIESILLKGHTTAEWLYPGEVRPYVDADLLVDPDRHRDSMDVLRRLGFVELEHDLSEHSHPWRRARDGAEVDLHSTLWGSSLSPSQVWATLQRYRQAEEIAAVQVNTLTLPARALVVILHAAQHAGDGKPHPRADLRRALALTPAEVWLEIDQLADDLDVLVHVWDALQLEPGAEALLARLPLVGAAALERTQRAPLAIALQRLANARGIRAKARVLARAVASPRDPATHERAHGGAIVRLHVMARLAAALVRTLAARRRARSDRAGP